MLARAALISLAFIHSATSTQAGDFQCPQAWWEQYKPGEFDRDFYQSKPTPLIPSGCQIITGHAFPGHRSFSTPRSRIDRPISLFEASRICGTLSG